MTDFLERYLTANAYGREIIVNEMDAEITTLRALASSRAGDMATVLAENAALLAECEAAVELMGIMQRPVIMDYDEETCGICGYREQDHADNCRYVAFREAYTQARAARLTRADGDGQRDE